jgi:hypothetical protein
MADVSEKRFPMCSVCGGDSEHPVIHVTEGANSVCIDVEIADLVRACWRIGIRTTNSCQAHSFKRGFQDMFLSFTDASDYTKFAQRVLEGGPRDDAVYHHMIGSVPGGVFGDDPREIPEPEKAWKWECIPFDNSTDGTPVFSWFCYVIFPASEVKAIERRLTASNP